MDAWPASHAPARLRELAAVADDHRLGCLARLGADGLDGLDHIQALGDVPEDDVLAVEPVRLDRAQEELRAVGARPGVGHREGARALVLELEVLVGEFGAVDGLTTGAVAAREVAALAPTEVRGAGFCSRAPGDCLRSPSARGTAAAYMKLLITRWNAEPLKWRGLPCVPIPFSPVQRARKFCAANRQCKSQAAMRAWRVPPAACGSAVLRPVPGTAARLARLGCLRHDVRTERHLDAAGRLAADRHVEEDHRVAHFE
eukprot:scaffold9322_cov120-Isochrysis_galbana.AAC.5